MKTLNNSIQEFIRTKSGKKFIFLLLLALITGETALIVINYSSVKFREIQLKAVASRILSKCSGENYRLVCYNNEIPKLLGEISLEDAFAVTRIVQDDDSALANCHIVAHKLISKSLEKNIDHWKEAITKCPVNVCQNGCLHGVIEAKFKNDRLTDAQLNSLVKDLNGICEPRTGWLPTQSQKSSCYHGLGHLFMYATGANLKIAPNLCSAITKKLGKGPLMNCLAGTFMQIYRFADDEDRLLVKNIAPKNEADVKKLCSQFTDPNYYQTCYIESWPLVQFAFLEDSLKPQKTTEFCSFIGDAYALQYCYQSVINEVTWVLVFRENKMDKINDYCNGLLENWRATCYEFASTHLVHVDPKYAEKAVLICTNAPKQYQDACLEVLARMSSSNFERGSADLIKFCNSFPDPWNKKCLTLSS